ncbi:MAG: FtsX-like permease family protein [Bacteroidales bacterium]
MLNNYLSIVLRIFRKKTLFSLVNIAGLAIGLAASIMIWLWVSDELSYDRFHENSGRIYRVERNINTDGIWTQTPVISPPVGVQIADDYPMVESFTRLAYNDVLIEDRNKNLARERMYYADSSFFKIFSFRVISGNPENCLRDSYTIALSRTLATKYFGNDPRPGGVLNVNANGSVRPYTVTAIYEDFPHNSHIQSGMIGSFPTLEASRPRMMMTGWLSSFLHTYILLSEDADHISLEYQMQEMVDKYFGPDLRNYLSIDDPNDFMKIVLTPLVDIHLESDSQYNLESGGSLTSVRVFSLVSLMLLLIAGINFMNLSTAKASGRALEVGVRKVMGANRSQLVTQFIGESLLFSFIALVVAVLLVTLLLPFFSDFTGKDMSVGMLLYGWNLPLILMAWLATAIFSGIWPAFFLSSFKPAKVLKGNMGADGGRLFRKSLVVAQFIISVGLIICAATVYRHVQYINNKDLGYNRKGLIDIPIENRNIFQSYEAFRHDLASLPRVIDVSRSMAIPTDRNFSDLPRVLRDNPEIFYPVINRADNRYLPVLELRMLAGENFTPEMVAETSNYYIINKAALNLFNFNNPVDILGKEIGFVTGSAGETGNWGQITGVVEDFHFQPLTEDIKPMIISSSLDAHNHITIRVDEKDIETVNREIREVWGRHFPDQLYVSNIVSQTFDMQHLTERRLQIILLIFTMMSIFISCLGLLGLSSYSIQQRVKEIGIRKAMGAKTFQIITLISSEFIRLVMIAAIIAMPAAYFIMRGWLNNFPYRQDPELWVFIGASIIALVTALITVITQTYKNSRINPVEILKYE